MSGIERETLTNIMETSAKLPEEKQEVILAYAQGMEAMLDKKPRA